MFTIVVRADLFKSFLEAALITGLSIPLNFQPDKIICDTVDTANTMLYSGVLIPESIEIDKPEVVMLEIGRASDVLTKAGITKTTLVTLTRVDGGIQLSINKVKYIIRQSVNPIRKMGTLKFAHPLSFNVETNGYAGGISALAAQTSKDDMKKAVSLTFKDNQLILQDDVDDPVTVTWEQDEISIIQQDTTDMQHCVISLEYLKESSSVLKIFDTLTLNMKTDSPFIIKGESEKIKLGFIIAPRIESKS